MPGIMPDNDVKGQFLALIAFLEGPIWGDVWKKLGLARPNFGTLGLPLTASDALVWHTCQAHDVVLFTGNRKQEGPDSLEATIRAHNQLTSLPVITLGDAKRFNYDRAYAEAAAVGVLDILLDLDSRRGAGRLYVP
jgi:hypothetical protein